MTCSEDVIRYVPSPFSAALKQIIDGGEGGGVIADISNREAVSWPTRFCAAERTSFAL